MVHIGEEIDDRDTTIEDRKIDKEEETDTNQVGEEDIHRDERDGIEQKEAGSIVFDEFDAMHIGAILEVYFSRITIDILIDAVAMSGIPTCLDHLAGNAIATVPISRDRNRES